MTIMKIALIVNNLVPLSGVGRVVINLASILKNYGYKIKIFAINCDSQFIKKYGISDSEIVCCNKLTILDRMIKVPVLGFLLQVIKFILFGFWLSVKLERNKPTIINSHYYFCGLSGWILSKIINIPHVLTIHGIHLSKAHMRTIHYWADYLILNFIKKHTFYLISVDPTLKISSQFKKVSESIEVIFPCLDRQFLHLLQTIEPTQTIKSGCGSGDGLKLIYVGRLEKHKGLEELLMKLAENKSTWAELKLIGSGTHEIRLKKLSKKLQIANKVKFLGVLDGRKKIQSMNDSDIFISFSRSEGFPLIILEFLALGKPCIIYPVGGIVSFYKEFKNRKLGIFLKTEQHFLRKILTGPYISQFFTKKTYEERKKFVQNFIPEKIAQKYMRFFSKIYEERK